jgi:hypothetical protein
MRASAVDDLESAKATLRVVKGAADAERQAEARVKEVQDQVEYLERLLYPVRRAHAAGALVFDETPDAPGISVPAVTELEQLKGKGSAKSEVASLKRQMDAHLSFHKLTVTQRDSAWEEIKQLKAEVEELRTKDSIWAASYLKLEAQVEGVAPLIVVVKSAIAKIERDGVTAGWQVAKGWLQTALDKVEVGGG